MADYEYDKKRNDYKVYFKDGEITQAQYEIALDFSVALVGKNIPSLAKTTEKILEQFEAKQFPAPLLYIAGAHLSQHTEYMPQAISALIRAIPNVPSPAMALDASAMLLGIANDASYFNDRRAQLASSTKHLIPTDDRIAELLLQETKDNKEIRGSRIKLGYDDEFNNLAQYARGIRTLANQFAATAERPTQAPQNRPPFSGPTPT